MTDFLLTEAIDEDQQDNEEEEGNNISTLSDEEFIDDSHFEDQNESDYYGFTNVMREYDDAIQDSLTDFDYNQEASNYVTENNDDDERIDEFKDFESKVEKLKKKLIFSTRFEKREFFLLFNFIRYKISFNEKIRHHL